MSCLANNGTIETEELNEEVDREKKPEDAANIIKQFEEILRPKSKGIISVAHHQRKLFSRFLEKEMFVRLAVNIGVHKNTIIFKINVFKLIDKHHQLMKSSVTLSFLKNYFKDIKRIC